MSAVAKTLGSLGIALVGLVIYLVIFVGVSAFDIPLFGIALYAAMALGAVVFFVVVTFAVNGGQTVE